MFKETRLKKEEFIWLGVIFWSIVFIAVEGPFSFTFNLEVRPWQLWADLIVSLIFTADFIQNLRRLQLKKVKDENALKPRWIVIGGIVVDAISCIPFEIIFWLAGAPHSIKAFKFLRMFRLIRVIKIIEIFNGLPTLAKKIKVQMYVVWSLVAIHWVACIWTMLGPIPSDVSIKSHYIKSFYWAVTTLTTIGYGDIIPHTDAGRIFTMVVMIAGVGLYGLVIGNISRIFAENTRYKEKSMQKMEELTFFMKHYHVPERLQQSVFSYYNRVYSKHLSDNDQRIISELPATIRSELEIYMGMKLIRNLPLFKFSSQACLKKVSIALEKRSFSPGETIIRIGEMGNEMYIIDHGSVDIILKDGQTVATLTDGQFFGEAALLEETIRNADVRANSYCDLHRLDKVKFLTIIEEHPELLNNMIEVTKKRESDRTYKKAS